MCFFSAEERSCGKGLFLHKGAGWTHIPWQGGMGMEEAPQGCPVVILAIKKSTKK